MDTRVLWGDGGGFEKEEGEEESSKDRDATRLVRRKGGPIMDPKVILLDAVTKTKLFYLTDRVEKHKKGCSLATLFFFVCQREKKLQRPEGNSVCVGGGRFPPSSTQRASYTVLTIKEERRGRIFQRKERKDP